MLAIRMQRTGRKGYPTYRVIVQESHRQPTSGKVVASLGSYNPHTKETTLDKEKAALYLKNGAQPSDRVVKLLQTEKVELPAWVKVTAPDKQKAIKNTEKLRRNQPKEEVVETPEEASAVEEVAPEVATDAPAETEQAVVEEAPQAEEAPEASAESADTEAPEEAPAEETTSDDKKA